VDDNATVRSTLSARLVGKGYEVTTASGGKEALSLLAKEKFNIVLLDIRMPDISGADVLREIRRTHSPTRLPVIMLTASDESDEIVQTFALGANDYVVKPGDITVLSARIDTHVTLKTANDALRGAHSELERKVVHSTVELQDSNAKLKWEMENRILMEEELRASERRYRALYDDSPSMSTTLSTSGDILSINKLSARHLGYRRNELLGKKALMLYHEADREMAEKYLLSVDAMSDRLHRWEIRKQHRSGETIWVRETACSIDFDSEERSLLVVTEDISETYQLSQRLNYQERYDELTGLLNRRSFEDRLVQALQQSREENRKHALCYLDLDQFKVVNDTEGHAVGDQVTIEVAGLLKKAIRNRDVLARLGGDEIVVLIEDCELEPATTVATALKDAIHEHHFVTGENVIRVHASIGLVPVTPNSTDVANLLSMADAACYTAKEAGRNRLHVHADDDIQLLLAVGEMRWVNRINEALAEDRFQLKAQPISPMGDQGCTGDHYELLLRMTDEDGNEVGPNEFLPAAERFNLAPKIDRWVFEIAFPWLRNNPGMLDNLYMCGINISGQSLGNEEMLNFLLKELDQDHFPAEKLCIEITETAAATDIVTATHFINALRDRGCKFALDDFGTGVSSFYYLKNLPVDFLKIDGAFVRDIATNTIDRAMVRSINEIGHVMGKKTIAEFVEGTNVLETLRSIGVDFAQGYGIGRPKPITDYYLESEAPRKTA